MILSILLCCKVEALIAFKIYIINGNVYIIHTINFKLIFFLKSYVRKHALLEPVRLLAEGRGGAVG